MKLALTLGLLLCASAQADISNPEIPQIVPKCGATDNQPQSDAIFQRSHCNTSGRGAHVTYYAACIYPTWDQDGVLLEYELYVFQPSRTPIFATC